MFGFNLSYALASNFKAISSASLKLNLNQENPLKKSFFSLSLVKFLKITSLIEMIEPSNFGHMIISAIYFK